MKGQKQSLRKIAAAMGRSVSTISRELKRNKQSHRPYSPSAAQNGYLKRRKNCGRKRILRNAQYQDLIRKLLGEYEWSPEQIENRLALEKHPLHISYATIYRAVRDGLFDPKAHYLKKTERFSYHLRRQGKPRRKNGSVNKQGKYPIPHTIAERPAGAEDRTEIGHFEADTVAGKKGSARLVTQVDRKSRYLLAVKVPDGSSEAVRDAMLAMFAGLPKNMLKSITPDRGPEFAKHAKVTEVLYQVPFYFADPYSPWQRGSNENTNGLLRQYFPKSTDLDPVSDERLAQIVDKLNHRPRKCLDWRSPAEVFFDCVLHLI